jgi:hypothetical protein
MRDFIKCVVIILLISLQSSIASDCKNIEGTIMTPRLFYEQRLGLAGVEPAFRGYGFSGGLEINSMFGLGVYYDRYAYRISENNISWRDFDSFFGGFISVDYNVFKNVSLGAMLGLVFQTRKSEGSRFRNDDWFPPLLPRFTINGKYSITNKLAIVGMVNYDAFLHSSLGIRSMISIESDSAILKYQPIRRNRLLVGFSTINIPLEMTPFSLSEQVISGNDFYSNLSRTHRNIKPMVRMLSVGIMDRNKNLFRLSGGNRTTVELPRFSEHNPVVYMYSWRIFDRIRLLQISYDYNLFSSFKNKDWAIYPTFSPSLVFQQSLSNNMLEFVDVNRINQSKIKSNIYYRSESMRYSSMLALGLNYYSNNLFMNTALNFYQFSYYDVVFRSQLYNYDSSKEDKYIDSEVLPQKSGKGFDNKLHYFISFAAGIVF